LDMFGPLTKTGCNFNLLDAEVNEKIAAVTAAR
jgi:hypothetical protein